MTIDNKVSKDQSTKPKQKEYTTYKWTEEQFIKSMSQAARTQNINLTNLLLGIIILFLAFLCIDQKYSYIKNNERQEKLHTLIKRYASYIEMQHLKEEGRRLEFANYFAEQNLPLEEIDTPKGDAKLLALGSDGIKAYLSLPSNSTEIINGIKNYVLNSSLYLHMHSLSFLTPSSYAEQGVKQTSNSSNINKNEEG